MAYFFSRSLLTWRVGWSGKKGKKSPSIYSGGQNKNYEQTLTLNLKEDNALTILTSRFHVVFCYPNCNYLAKVFICWFFFEKVEKVDSLAGFASWRSWDVRLCLTRLRTRPDYYRGFGFRGWELRRLRWFGVLLGFLLHSWIFGILFGF